MKKIFACAFLLVSTVCISQKLETAKDLFKQNKIVEAKKEIDLILQDPKNQQNADAWYTKAKIYNGIAALSSPGTEITGAREAAFKALIKYTELDEKMLISLQIDGYKPINDIYTGFYQSAANSFNNKNYEKALEGFKKAIEVSSFMTKKGWIKLALDTNSVLYAGVAAEKLQKPDEAVNYYGKLVEARVMGEGFAEIYKWVANYYFEKNNLEKTISYSNIGKSVYPSDPFWASLELDMARQAGDKNKLFAKYESTIAEFPSNYLYRYNYAVELYQEGYKTEISARPANSSALIQKAKEQLNEVLNVKPDYSRAQLFNGQIIYNSGVDLLNQAKAVTGTAPDDVKKKSALKAEAIKQFEQAIPYFQNVEKLLTAKGKLDKADKEDLKEAFDLLITIYDQKGDKEKTKEYERKFSETDKKY